MSATTERPPLRTGYTRNGKKIGRPRIRPVEAPLDPVSPLKVAAQRRQDATSKRLSAAWYAKQAALKAAAEQAEQDRREREAAAASHEEWMRRMDQLMYQRPAPLLEPQRVSVRDAALARIVADLRQPRYY